MNSLLVKKLPSEDRQKPTVITTASGKDRVDEEVTVYTNDFNVFVAMMLLEDPPAVLSQGLSCEEMSYSCDWTQGESPSLCKDAKLTKVHV